MVCPCLGAVPGRCVGQFFVLKTFVVGDNHDFTLVSYDITHNDVYLYTTSFWFRIIWM
jgi:hypothetical protein